MLLADMEDEYISELTTYTQFDLPCVLQLKTLRILL